jgi:hypothetical protein
MGVDMGSCSIGQSDLLLILMSPEVEMLAKLAKLVMSQQQYDGDFSAEEMMAIWEAHQDLLDFWERVVHYRVDDEVH